MARKGKSDDVEFVLEDEEEPQEEEEVEVSTTKRAGIKGGDVERYEVRIGPPVVSGRKVKPLRTPEEKVEKPRELKPPGQQQVGPYSQQGISSSSLSVAGTQQIYKIEDDLRRTRDIVEDLKHNMGIMEGDVKDLKAEMDRMSYLLRSLEGLKNAMKDIESTVSELSGLYDLISANINPFVEIQPLESREKVIKPTMVSEVPESEKEGSEGFQEVDDIFDEEMEEEEELEQGWGGPDLESEEWILRWTKFLMDKVGKEGLERTLDYYVDLGWIDEDLTDKVLEIARGTVGPKVHPEGKKVTWRMDAEDHVKSLEFIRRVRTKRR
jgi:archaellum component FlaD/FlaE